MPPKPDLRQAINSVNTRHAEVVRDVAAQPAALAIGEHNPHYRPSREGKGNVTGYYPPAVKKQLRFLAAENDTDIQDLVAEALNDLFAKYGKPEIAPRKVKK